MQKSNFWVIEFTVEQKKPFGIGNLAKLLFWSILSFKNWKEFWEDSEEMYSQHIPGLSINKKIENICFSDRGKIGYHVGIFEEF